jgi:hypothetical protein
MRNKGTRRRILLAATAPLLGWSLGCSQPDNPPLTEAPVFTPEPNPEPPKIKGRTEPYGSNKKYQEAMERQGQRR